MDISPFKNNLPKYANLYDSSKLFDKIAKIAKKVGVNSIYMVLLLYYALIDKHLPMTDRLVVMAALGYLILPFDLLPDNIPIVGYVDDLDALKYALQRVWDNITPNVHIKARSRLQDWFGSVSDSELYIPGM